MASWLLSRKLASTSKRLVSARKELNVVTEQMAQLRDEAEDSELRAMVAESPMAGIEHRDNNRHAAAHERQRERLITQIRSLEQRQDELLDQLNATRAGRSSA